ncbi:MAG TPA: Coenzyme F420 hydrogenase/dehydrogenase, beta subunit C-terminal domain [Syntrophomonadaceae bacterium]|nr:Coenzyme F420 hydrogenase/dehydrogenase, beta subunit C-terminal domain [Syntrophomonadaceae bacterium]
MPGGMDLKNDVLNNGTCALCGACLDWCPYIKNMEDHLVLRFDCNVPHGRCYSLCPRTFTDWEEVSNHFLPAIPKDEKIGPYLKVHKVKASQAIDGQQDGGTVTHLLKTVLEEELVETVLLTKTDDNIVPQALLTNDLTEVEKAAGSRFLAAPSFRKLIDAQLDGTKRMAVVGRPCQIQAVRKWDYFRRPERDSVDVIGIGLFCMWSLKWDFQDFLEEEFAGEKVERLVMLQDGVKVITDKQTKHISAEELGPYTRPEGCNYCLDMTSELADISVGALEIEPGWNTVIIRTNKGQELFDKAVEKGYLVVEDYPEDELNRLKDASLGKKVRSFKHIMEAETRGVKPFIDLNSGEYAPIRKLAEGMVE